MDKEWDAPKDGARRWLVAAGVTLVAVVLLLVFTDGTEEDLGAPRLTERGILAGGSYAVADDRIYVFEFVELTDDPDEQRNRFRVHDLDGKLLAQAYVGNKTAILTNQNVVDGVHYGPMRSFEMAEGTSFPTPWDFDFYPYVVRDDWACGIDFSGLGCHRVDGSASWHQELPKPDGGCVNSAYFRDVEGDDALFVCHGGEGNIVDIAPHLYDLETGGTPRPVPLEPEESLGRTPFGPPQHPAFLVPEALVLAVETPDGIHLRILDRDDLHVVREEPVTGPDEFLTISHKNGDCWSFLTLERLPEEEHKGGFLRYYMGCGTELTHRVQSMDHRVAGLQPAWDVHPLDGGKAVAYQEGRIHVRDSVEGLADLDGVTVEPWRGLVLD